MNTPIIDLHCDLLSYLLDAPHPDPLSTTGVGCNLTSLKEGNLKLQIMAIYTSTEKGSSAKALQQSLFFKDLLLKYPERLELFNQADQLGSILNSPKINVLAAIENASGFCEEDEPLEDGFRKLETIIQNTERILYIGFTHHGENRFGGGNTSQAGLKDDGKALLQYLDGRKIAVDFSHTSDALAHDMLDYIVQHSLDIPIIASHSNYRPVFHHLRNLPDDIATEIIQRGGLIGVNFLRAFMNNDDADAIYDHIQHGLGLGGAKSICFGADYFYTDNHPDQTRRPFFHPAHENASCYPAIINGLSERFSPEVVRGIASGNVLDFIGKVWGEGVFE